MIVQILRHIYQDVYDYIEACLMIRRNVVVQEVLKTVL